MIVFHDYYSKPAALWNTENYFTFFSNGQILCKRIVDILELERTLKTVQLSHFSDEGTAF